MNSKLCSQSNAASQPGFSLIEIVIGMTLFSMVAMASFKCLGEGLSISKKRMNHDLANQMLQEEMEYLRSLSFTEISALSSAGTFNQTPPHSRFTTSRLISDRAGRADQKIVKISISWHDSNGNPHLCSGISFFTEHGISN